MHGSVFLLDNAAFDEEYRSGERPPKLQLDSRYGLSFRFCLIHQITEVYRRLSHDKKFEKTRLNIVVESGHSNAGAAITIFNQEKKELKSAGGLLAGITFAEKSECSPLMIADFLAHTTYMRGDIAYTEPTATQISQFREKAGLTYLKFDPGGLAQLRGSLFKKLEARRAWGASRQVSSSLNPVSSEEEK